MAAKRGKIPHAVTGPARAEGARFPFGRPGDTSRARPPICPPACQSDPLNPAFASNLEPFIAESGAAPWIHGHIHHHADYRIGSTRVLANPRGYPREAGTGFVPSLTVEI